MAAAEAQVALNLILCDSLDAIATRLEAAVASDPDSLNAEVENIIRDIMEEDSAVLFNGDGYSEIWHREAERRGLPNNATTPEALPVLMDPQTIELYSRFNVLNKQELNARLEIYLEQYSKTINTEAHVALRMARTIIYPAGLRYLNELAEVAGRLTALKCETDTALLERVQTTLKKLGNSTDRLEKLLGMSNGSSAQKIAEFYCNQVLPAMSELRTYADDLEILVPEDLWPLPSYQEMLFIK